MSFNHSKVFCCSNSISLSFKNDFISSSRWLDWHFGQPWPFRCDWAICSKSPWIGQVIVILLCKLPFKVVLLYMYFPLWTFCSISMNDSLSYDWLLALFSVPHFGHPWPIRCFEGVIWNSPCYGQITVIFSCILLYTVFE